VGEGCVLVDVYGSTWESEVVEPEVVDITLGLSEGETYPSSTEACWNLIGI